MAESSFASVREPKAKPRVKLGGSSPLRICSDGSFAPGAPRLDGFDIAAVIEPAYEVGGDYYDYIPLGSDRWAVAMADVWGKGAPAALVVAAMRATFYTLAKRELALRAILQRTNELIHASTGPKAKYVTLFYLVLDAQARRFIYINAGHLLRSCFARMDRWSSCAPVAFHSAFSTTPAISNNSFNSRAVTSFVSIPTASPKQATRRTRTMGGAVCSRS